MSRIDQLDYIEQHPGQIEDIVEKLCQPGYRGQIVGPHGVGKSTLLRDLKDRLEEAGFNVLLERGSMLKARRPKSAERTILLLDEYAELSLSQRLMLLYFRSRFRAILITTHEQRIGFDLAARLVPTHRILNKLIDQLTKNSQTLIQPTTVAYLYRKHHGNLREVLRELYDRTGQNLD